MKKFIFLENWRNKYKKRIKKFIFLENWRNELNCVSKFLTFFIKYHLILSIPTIDCMINDSKNVSKTFFNYLI